MCWVVEPMNMFYHRNVTHWKDYRVYDHEKVKFHRLVAYYWTFNWTVKGLFTQTKQNKTKQKQKKIVTTDFNLPGPSLVSNPLTEILEEVSFLERICPFNLSSNNHENDNNPIILNARNQIYLLDRYRDQRNATVK